MDWKTEWKKLALIVGVFLGCFWLPVGSARFDGALIEGLHLVKWYAREHVLLCLVPAFFIAGALSVFISQASVMKYLGAKAHKALAYGVASVSGAVLAVCSCTVLPLFAGIYRMGAGLGPATAFLYAGPAINVLAIILTARVLGLELGIARAVCAVVSSIVLGLLMHVLFRKEERARAEAQAAMPEPEVARPLWQNALVFAAMVGVLVSANWAVSGRFQFGVACCPSPRAMRIHQMEGVRAGEDADHIYVEARDGETERIPKDLLRWEWPVESPAYLAIHRARFVIAGLMFAALFVMLVRWFPRSELREWTHASWDLAKQILPLLLLGVLLAGFLLGRQGREGVIPSEWVTSAVGGNSLRANLLAAIAGAFMYFATLTEVPILEGLIGSGMGKGPALALLLAGPALSLPNMLVIRSVLGVRKTLVFISLVIVISTVSGVVFGALFA